MSALCGKVDSHSAAFRWSGGKDHNHLVDCLLFVVPAEAEAAVLLHTHSLSLEVQSRTASLIAQGAAEAAERHLSVSRSDGRRTV